MGKIDRNAFTNIHNSLLLYHGIRLFVLHLINTPPVSKFSRLLDVAGKW